MLKPVIYYLTPFLTQATTQIRSLKPSGAYRPITKWFRVLYRTWTQNQQQVRGLSKS